MRVSFINIGSIDAKQFKEVIQITEPSDFDTLERNVADCELCRSEIVDAIEAVWWRDSPLTLSLNLECDIFPSVPAAFGGFF